ncbi:hypothetical protein JT358_06705 [Micrococcales bacterium 31B]|nr:hypothetical protein [Micrococcales bacterium 31B]
MSSPSVRPLRVGRRGLFAASAALLGAAALTSCASGLPDPVMATAAPLADDALVTPLNDATLRRIVADLSSVLQDADSKRDAALLEARLAGPALEQRRALYTWWDSPEDDRPVTAIAPKALADTINIAIASSATSYPRDVLLVINSPEPTEFSANYILLGMRQASAQENFKVWAGINLMVPQPDPQAPFLGLGAAFPTANARVELDAATFVRTPREAVQHYLELLNTGASSQYAAEFYADGYQNKVNLLRRQFEVAVKGAEGAPEGTVQYLNSAKVEYSTDFANATALLTEDGSAVVLVQVTCTITLENADPSSQLQVFLPKYRALAASPEFQNRLVIENTLVGAFTIPPADAEDPLVRCIGFDADLGEGLGQSSVSYVDDQPGPNQGKTVTTLTQTSDDGPGDGWGATKVTVS